MIGGQYLNASHIIRLGRSVTGMRVVYLVDGHEVSISEDELDALISYLPINVSILDPKVKRDE